MAASHVNIRLNDWTSDKECHFSMSRFYREIARNSRHLLGKYQKLSSNVAVPRDFEMGVASRRAHTNPTHIFLRDRNTLTRGEREIIEGIHRNRAETSTSNSFLKSEWQDVSSLADRFSIKACSENRSLGRNAVLTENICGKSIIHSEDADPCKDYSLSSFHASRDKHNPLQHLPHDQGTRGLASEDRTKHSADYPVPWVSHPWPPESQDAKETLKHTVRDLHKESFVDDAMLTICSKLDQIQNRANPPPRRLPTVANENVPKLQSHVRNMPTVPPILTISSSNERSELAMRSEKADQLHARVNKLNPGRMKTEQLMRLVECNQNNGGNIVNLNVQQGSRDGADIQQVCTNHNDESRWNRTIQIYLPTVEAELAEDDESLKPDWSRREMISKEKPLSHKEFHKRLRGKATAKENTSCHQE